MRSVIASGIDYRTLLYSLTDDYGAPLTDDAGLPLVLDGDRALDVVAATAFDNIIAGSHTMTARCDVLFNREVIAEGLPVVGGSVTFDRTAQVLASCSVTIADPDRVPVDSSDVLTPFGYELRLWRGVQAGGGTIMCALGTFPIQRSSVDGVTLLSAISGQDRSKLVSDALVEEVYQVDAGTNYATAIEAFIADGVSGLDYNFPTTGFTTPLLTFTADDNRWTSAQGMARSIGMELFFDGLGVATMRSEPTFSSEPIATIAEGSNMVSATLGLDRGPAYNKVIATSSNASNGDPYRGSATDDDPQSPSYYFGGFGKKARRYASPFLASDAQCDSAAAAVLAANIGVAKSVSVGMLTDPRIETSDVLTVTRSALNLDELHIVDGMTIGLGAGDIMTANVRAQQSGS